MSDEQDDSQKTEEATPKRLEEARKKGQVVSSKEITHWFMIFGSALALLLASPIYMRPLAEDLSVFFHGSHIIFSDGENLLDFFRQFLLRIGFWVLIPLSILMVTAFLGNVVQNGFFVSGESLIPKLEKLSPLKGIKRLFSMKSLIEFLKGLLKIGLIGGGAIWITKNTLPPVATFVGIGVDRAMRSLWIQAAYIFVTILALLFFVAAFDYLYQFLSHRKQLRMTKQELKEEYKQSEGDPQIKGKLRQLRQERARQRMMSAVPTATVIITNPTHFSVALRYESTTMTAPMVVAKGQDHLALKIREIAREHGIPLMENPPLARALYAGVDIDREIPEEHYTAVAEVIRYVMKIKGVAKL